MVSHDQIYDSRICDFSYNFCIIFCEKILDVLTVQYGQIKYGHQKFCNYELRAWSALN